MYSQTWTNDNFRITTTCLQRPSFWSRNLILFSKNLHLNNDHLLTTATNLGSRGWSLYTGLTVFTSKIQFSKNVENWLEFALVSALLLVPPFLALILSCPKHSTTKAWCSETNGTCLQFFEIGSRVAISENTNVKTDSVKSEPTAVFK